MLQLPIRRFLAWTSVSPLFMLLFGAPGFCSAQARGTEDVVNGVTPLTADPVAADLLLFGLLALAAASAAVAVRMVRRSH